MGHTRAKQSRAVTTLQQIPCLTLRSAEDLITAAAKALHTVMKRYRRDRWWFLGGQRLQPPPQPPVGYAWSSPPQSHDLRTQVIGTHTLFWGEAPGLACTIRANWYGGGRPPVIVAEFRRDVDKPLTVQVGLHGERYAPVGLKRPTFRRLPARNRHAFLEQYLKAARRIAPQKPSRAFKRWWIDPDRTPVEATRFVFLLYLWQVHMISIAPGQQAWAFVKKFIRSKDDGQMLLILQRIRTHYAFPQHWKELRVYIGYVIRDLAAQKAGRRDIIAARYGISRRTFYRWINEGRVSRNGKAALDEKGWADVERLAGKRALRQEAMRLLIEEGGKSGEAARKMIYRHLQGGKSLEPMVRRLRRGECL